MAVLLSFSRATWKCKFYLLIPYAIEGFKKSRVFPWNLSIIDDKRPVPSTMFEKQTELPDVNSSINEGVPASGDKGNEDDVQNVTQTVAEVHSKPAKAKEPSGMAATIRPNGLLEEIIIDGIHYTMIPLDELKEACVPTMSATVPVSSAKRSKILNKVLTTLVVKKKTLGGLHVKDFEMYIIKRFPEINEG